MKVENSSSVSSSMSDMFVRVNNIENDPPCLKDQEALRNTEGPLRSCIVGGAEVKR